MARHRPSSLKLFLNHCPAAVDLYESGAKQDRRVFAVGTAAHEVLHALAEGRDVDDVCRRLISVGRTGNDPEPPLPPSAVFQGRDLALAYVDRHPIPAGALYEQRYGFDQHWQPDPSPNAYFAATIDRVHVVEEVDEDGHGYKVVTVTDYKSAWSATDEELDTLQRRAQAVCAWLMHPDAVEIVLEVANLRRRWNYRRVIVLDEDGDALLQRWRRDLEIACRALDVQPRLASPSPGCARCPYVLSCVHGDALLSHSAESAPDAARHLGYARGVVATMTDRLKAATEDEPITVDGWTVGHLARRRETFESESTRDLINRWTARGGNASDLAEELGASTTMIRALAKRVIPDREERDAWLRAHVVERIIPEFGFGPTGEVDAVAAPKAEKPSRRSAKNAFDGF